MNAAYWLSLYGLLRLPSYTTDDYLPMGGATHSGLGSPTSVINQEDTLQTCLQAI